MGHNREMHHLVDALLEEADDSVDYQKQLQEIIDIDKEFRLLEEYLNVGKKYYRSLAKQAEELKKTKSATLCRS